MTPSDLLNCGLPAGPSRTLSSLPIDLHQQTPRETRAQPSRRYYTGKQQTSR